MGEEQFGRAVLLLPGEGADAQQGGEQRAADAQDIPAFNPVVAGQGSEVQRFHAEGLRKGAHGGEYRGNAVHLAFHFREDQEADDNKGADGAGPDQEGFPAAPEFMAEQGHA